METLSESVRRRIREALAEDIGRGDWTTQWCVGSEVRVDAEIVAKADGVIAGLAAAAEVFRQLGDTNGEVSFRPFVSDGQTVTAARAIARVMGSAQAILSGERVALNLLMHLSGVATLTRQFVDAVEGTGVKITDTRKTTPLWRELEKAAIQAGGAVNHRRGLDDMVLIKGNHLACAENVHGAVERVRNANLQGLRVEVEATDLEEVRATLDAGVDRIMLDNMPIERVLEAMSLIDERAPRPEVEVSGGVTLDTVRKLAETGVDYISVGALTHSAPALDLSLRIRTVTS